MNRIIGIYKNGNYNVTLFNDGTKIRSTKHDAFVPAFSENCDVKITDKCDGCCPYCYEGCTIKGNHGKLMNADGTPYWKFIESLHPYTELALNGNDLTHPELIPFLEFLKSKKVIANLTVNQMHVRRNSDMIEDLLKRNLIKGLGISLTDSNDEWILKFAESHKNAVLHTIAGILTDYDIANMKKHKNLKVLILGYKTLGRGEEYIKTNESVNENINMLKNNLSDVVKTFKVVSFDNLAIEQLDVKKTLFEGKENEWESFYMGDDGNFTFYMDLVKGEYSRNSCTPYNERKKIENLTVDEMFSDIRKNL